MNYIGSKFSILAFIEESIIDFVNPTSNNITLCDIFSGTANVGKYFKNKGYNIISNDIQYYSYVISKHYIENNKILTFDKLKEKDIEPFDYLNNLKGINGFIYNNYSMGGTEDKQFQRQYFTDNNAQKIDEIRKQIESWKNNELINTNEYFYLLTCLIEAADKVANTASVYEAFLKKVKRSAQNDIKLVPVDTFVYPGEKMYSVYNEDCHDLIKKISGDILYLDPPYNSRKYDTNYHILETIALNDSPEIKGKTGVRAESSKKSKFCQKKEATGALEDIIKNAKFKYILLSYNDEGIIPIEEIKHIMSKYGKYKCYAKRHRRFKSDCNRDYIKDFTIEYIHCLEKKDK